MRYQTPRRPRTPEYMAAMGWWQKLRRRPTNPFVPPFGSAKDMQARGLRTCAEIERYYRARIVVLLPGGNDAGLPGRFGVRASFFK